MVSIGRLGEANKFGNDFRQSKQWNGNVNKRNSHKNDYGADRGFKNRGNGDDMRQGNSQPYPEQAPKFEPKASGGRGNRNEQRPRKDFQAASGVNQSRGGRGERAAKQASNWQSDKFET